MRFAYDAPAALSIIEPDISTGTCEKFVKYTGDGFDPGSMSDALCPPQSEFEVMSDAERMAEFAAWFDRVANPDPLAESHQSRGGYADQDRPWLWRHFSSERLVGKTSGEIGRPERGSEMIANTPGAASAEKPGNQTILPYPALKPGARTATSPPVNRTNGKAQQAELALPQPIKVGGRKIPSTDPRIKIAKVERPRLAAILGDSDRSQS